MKPTLLPCARNSLNEDHRAIHVMTNRERTGLLILLGVGLFYLWQRSTVSGQRFIQTATGDIIAVANKISDYGLSLIKKFETLQLSAYWDVDGYSIGYGHHFLPGETYTTIDEATADQLLVSDTAKAQDAINSYVTVPLNQNQFDALTDFVFNEGVGHFESSTLLKKLNAGDISGAAAEFDKWIYAGGAVVDALINRRAAEKALFLSA